MGWDGMRWDEMRWCCSVQYDERWFSGGVQTHRPLRDHHHHHHHTRHQLPPHHHPIRRLRPLTRVTDVTMTSRVTCPSRRRVTQLRRDAVTSWIDDVIITIIIVLVCIICNITCVASHLIYSLEASAARLQINYFSRRSILIKFIWLCSKTIRYDERNV